MGVTDVGRHHLFTTHDVHSRSTPFDRWALEQIQHSVRNVPVRLVLWDGTTVGPRAAPLATILFKRRAALWSWLWDAQLYFATPTCERRRSRPGGCSCSKWFSHVVRATRFRGRA